MIAHTNQLDRARGDERGFALPLALTALVAITILVTAGILSSATEVTISNAHQAGTTGFYNADGALESYVATKLQGSTTSPPTDSLYPILNDLSVPKFSISVQRIRNLQRIDPATNIEAQDQEYSVLAQPASGSPGRSVGTIVSTHRRFQRIRVNIQAGAVSGGGLDNSGNSKISAYSDLCEGDTTGIGLMFTSDVTAAEKAKVDTSKIVGDTASYTDVTADQLIRHILGGATSTEVFAGATIKFGYDGKPAYVESKKPSSITYSDTSSYNWGCPTRMGVTCDSPQDTLRIPIIAIDANKLTIGLQGDHGQGILYIRNGNVKITGQFIFKGSIIVDGGRFEVAGTGTEGTKIEGSLVATGGLTDSRVSGNAVVNYNPCANESAAAAFNLNGIKNAPQTVQQMTGWFEVVR